MTTTKTTIVYMGTPHYAAAILRTLIDADDMHVALVITQPDRPVGRKKVITPPPVKTLAQAYAIPVLQPQRLSEEGIVAAIQAAGPDFIVVAAFGQLLPPSILEIAPCINLHASLLPQYRGASPVQQSLLHGDAETGVTSMRMDAGLDTGDILETRVVPIPPDMRLQALMAQLTQDACVVTLSTLRRFEHIVPRKQDDRLASYCKKIRKSDGEVRFEHAENLYNRYRAFEGWPGIHLPGGTKLDAVTLIAAHGLHTPGEILACDGEDVIVGCADGAVQIGILQPPSKKPMHAKAYCVGRGLHVGDSIL